MARSRSVRRTWLCPITRSSTGGGTTAEPLEVDGISAPLWLWLVEFDDDDMGSTASGASLRLPVAVLARRSVMSVFSMFGRLCVYVYGLFISSSPNIHSNKTAYCVYLYRDLRPLGICDIAGDGHHVCHCDPEARAGSTHTAGGRYRRSRRCLVLCRGLDRVSVRGHGGAGSRVGGRTTTSHKPPTDNEARMKSRPFVFLCSIKTVSFIFTFLLNTALS